MKIGAGVCGPIGRTQPEHGGGDRHLSMRRFSESRVVTAT